MDQCDLFKQLGEIDRWFSGLNNFSLARDIPFIAVDILTKQCHFTVTLLKEIGGFLYNALRITASFAASGERHDAEGTHVVAATHDRNKRGNAIAVEAYRCDLRIRFF